MQINFLANNNLQCGGRNLQTMKRLAEVNVVNAVDYRCSFLKKKSYLIQRHKDAMLDENGGL